MSAVVSASWLKSHLGEEDLVILDAGVARVPGAYSSGLPDFEQEHLPGSRHADLLSDLSDPSGSFAFARPSAESFTRSMRALGVDQRTHVVAYDRLSGAWAARVWWLLRSFGHPNVSVLDGGLDAWLRAGGELESGAARSGEAGDFVAVDHPEMVAGIDEVARISAERQGSPLVCALRPEVFSGLGSDDARRGHIPGSSNVPYNDFLAPDKTFDRDRAAVLATKLRAELTAPDDAVILYCGGGINAAGAALGLHLGGLDRVRLYDGSMSEWKARTDLPLEVGA